MMFFATFWQMNAKYSTVSFSENFSDTKACESLTISHHSSIDLSTKCSIKSDADYSVFNTNTSLATCNPPTSPQDSYVTSTTAKISWTPPAVSPANGYEIYYSNNNVPPTAATAPTLTGIFGVNTNLTGLTPSKGYYVYVRSNCSPTEKSVWTESTVFVTNCPVVAEFTQNFDSVNDPNLPNCWRRINGLGDVNVQPAPIGSPPNALRMYSATVPKVAMISLPPVNTLQSGNYKLRFKLRGNSAPGGKLEVGYLIDQQNLATFVLLYTYTANSISVVDNYETPPIVAPPGIETLAFRASPTPATAILIDDVVYSLASSCTEPTTIKANALQTNGATISWTAPVNVPANGYEIYYSTVNTAPTAATPPTITGVNALSIVLSSLNSATKYYLWVRSNCSPAEKSIWTNSINFVTLCNNANPPYTMDFSTAVYPDLPICTSASNEGSGSIWDVRPAAPGFTGKLLEYSYNTLFPANTWFYTQGINLVKGNTYSIGYKYGNNSTTYKEKLKVAIGTSPTAAAMTTTIGNYPSISTLTPITETNKTFKPTISGVYYLGFQAYSDPKQDHLYLDDIKVTTIALATDETSHGENLLKIYPNPFSEFVNISEFENIEKILITDASGRFIKTVRPSKSLNLKNLSKGLYLINLQMKDGSVQIIKAIKK